VNQAEPLADDPGVSEELSNLIGGRIGGNIEVFRLLSQEEISHGTSNHIRAVTVGRETPHHLESILIDPFAIDSMILFGEDLCLFYRFALFRRAVSNAQGTTFTPGERV